MKHQLFISNLSLRGEMAASDNGQKGEGEAVSEAQKRAERFVYKKSEKLATAVYMVTSYMTEDEPLRSALRQSALDFLATTKQSIGHRKEGGYATLQKDILYIVSLITLAKTIQAVSHMNASILETEYQSLYDFLSTQEVVKDIHPFDLGIDIEESLYRDRQRAGGERESLPPLSPVEQAPAGATKEAITPTAKKEKDAASLREKKERKVTRREQILTLLRENNSVTIREITTRIKGCSEKTLQRELGILVEEKKIKRVGEKRWSKYMLAS